MIFITLAFVLFILAIIIGANTGTLPSLVSGFYDFPGGDKLGHFFLFGILGFLLNKSALALFPKRNPPVSS